MPSIVLWQVKITARLTKSSFLCWWSSSKVETTVSNRQILDTTLRRGQGDSLAHSTSHCSHSRRRANMTTDKNHEIGYAPVNGLDLYYEIRGSGQPLVLLPGGFMTVEAMGELVPQLATTRRVIGVELQGHGHTADTERALRFELMADDIAALIRHLGLEQADLFGFSLGGGVGLQTAIRHPEVVRKLVLASTAFKRDGWYPEVLAGMASISVDTSAGSLARGAAGHHACGLGSTLSWAHEPHPPAPTDHHGIPRFSLSTLLATSWEGVSPFDWSCVTMRHAKVKAYSMLPARGHREHPSYLSPIERQIVGNRALRAEQIVAESI